MAQTLVLPPVPQTDTTITLVSPVVLYTSDTGLLGGGTLGRYRYGSTASKTESTTELAALLSTRLFAQLHLNHTHHTGSWRVKWTVDIERHPMAFFFGLGNQTELDRERWTEAYYDYLRRSTMAGLKGTRTLASRVDGAGTLDLGVLLQVHSMYPQAYEASLLDDPQFSEDRGGTMLVLGTELVLDRRDHRLAPGRGYYAAVAADWSPGGFTGPYAAGSIRFDARAYVPVPGIALVLAGRLAGESVHGQVPWFMQAHLGDDQSLRGYPRHRFRGDRSLAGSLELRSWLVERPRDDFRFGIHGFYDTGRVFLRGESSNGLTEGLHQTWGGGVAFGLFSPDVILRLETGVSKEALRFYMNLGYMF